MHGRSQINHSNFNVTGKYNGGRSREFSGGERRPIIDTRDYKIAAGTWLYITLEIAPSYDGVNAILMR